MSGHNCKVARSAFQNTALFDKFQCPCCFFLLNNAVQLICGHWLCESCANREVLASSLPKCPRLECQEDLQADTKEERHYFPDRFVRREIKKLIVYCPNRQEGCNWKDKLGNLEDHLKTCGSECPLVDFGCTTTNLMNKGDLEKHMGDCEVQHFRIIRDMLKLFQSSNCESSCSQPYKSMVDLSLEQGIQHPKQESSKRVCSNAPLIGQSIAQPLGVIEKNSSSKAGDVVDDLGLHLFALRKEIERSRHEKKQEKEENELLKYKVQKLERLFSFHTDLNGELQRKDEEIQMLKTTIARLEKSMRSKHAEFEDRDFRPSLIENSNYDGTTVWKIPQFSQRMSDAQTGKYTSIFSLPFYTGRYGYKMCLRLYILGDGDGKNSHMSLFFVIMKGESDNVLQWPFTHKVTFKLINQTGGRDIIDTIQPHLELMSSSFCKPESDMNIASGCPRFVSHTELKSGGFIVDDTVLIKCSVDCNTVHL